MLNIRVLIKSFHTTRTFYLLRLKKKKIYEIYQNQNIYGGPNEYISLIFLILVTCMYRIFDTQRMESDATL